MVVDSLHMTAPRYVHLVTTETHNTLQHDSQYAYPQYEQDIPSFAEHVVTSTDQEQASPTDYQKQGTSSSMQQVLCT